MKYRLRQQMAAREQSFCVHMSCSGRGGLLLKLSASLNASYNLSEIRRTAMAQFGINGANGVSLTCHGTYGNVAVPLTATNAPEFFRQAVACKSSLLISVREVRPQPAMVFNRRRF